MLEITFPSFTPRITFRSERELTIEIFAGENAGFSDTVEYKMVVAMVSWCSPGRSTSAIRLCTYSI